MTEPVPTDAVTTLLASSEAAVLRRLRRTFQLSPSSASRAAQREDLTDVPRAGILRRRGTLLIGGELAVAGLLTDRDEGAAVATADLAWVWAHLPSCGAVAVVATADRTAVVERICPPERAEILPDIFTTARLLDAGVPLAVSHDPVAWTMMRWLSLRLPPHRAWMITVAADDGATQSRAVRDRRGEEHRKLRAVMAAFREQAV